MKQYTFSEVQESLRNSHLIQLAAVVQPAGIIHEHAVASNQCRTGAFFQVGEFRARTEYLSGQSRCLKCYARLAVTICRRVKYSARAPGNLDITQGNWPFCRALPPTGTRELLRSMSDDQLVCNPHAVE